MDLEILKEMTMETLDEMLANLKELERLKAILMDKIMDELERIKDGND
jgi:hypothetical protein